MPKVEATGIEIDRLHNEDLYDLRSSANVIKKKVKLSL
jgi:hypothetical protein